MNNLITDPGITVTPHGALVTRTLTFDEWRRAMHSTRQVKRAYHAVLADLTGYGRLHFGEKAVADAMEQLEFEMDDANKATAIHKLPLEFRTLHGLDSEQAFVLSSVKDEDERTRWAETCRKENLTALELKRSIEAGKVMRKEDLAKACGQGAGLPTVQAVRFQFERWQRSIGGKQKILSLTPSARKEALKTLEPIIELAAELQLSLETLV
jgi:hypothetical protein